MELKFTWKIDNFTKLEATRLCSRIFSLGCSKWRVVIYPKGNGDSINTHVSMFLAVANSSRLPLGWSRSCKFRLLVVDQIDAKYTITREGEREFNAQKSNWGYTSIMLLSKLHDLSRGYVVNDSCMIQAEVDVNNAFEEVSSDSEEVSSDSEEETPSLGDQEELREGTSEGNDHPSIDVNWANETAEGMMVVALKNLRDDQLSFQGFSAMADVLKKSFSSLGASQQLFEDTWRPWIDNILQSLKDLDRMEEALKMNSIEAAIKESLLKITETCQLQELSNSNLASEGVLDEQLITELKGGEPQNDETTDEQYDKEPRLKKRRAALLSANSTLEGLKSHKAKLEGQLEDLHTQVADRGKTLIEKKAEIRLRIQIHPTQQDRSPP